MRIPPFARRARRTGGGHTGHRGLMRLPLALLAGATTIGAALLLRGGGAGPARWAIAAATAALAILTIHEGLGRPIPFLRWSFLRMLLGMRTLLADWQVGDGREERATRYVLAHAPAGSLDAAIDALDEYAYRRRFLINIGDEKGRILDAALDRAGARTVLELGAYVGYSALRIARRLPAGGRLYSIERNPANAALARRIVAHAGAADRVTILVGALGDDGQTLARLREACGAGSVDLVFIDHAKDAYLPDLLRLLDGGFLHRGTVVVADNIGFPGAPAYRAYMKAAEGRIWQSRAHETYAEYQALIRDLVLESRLL